MSIIVLYVILTVLLCGFLNESSLHFFILGVTQGSFSSVFSHIFVQICDKSLTVDKLTVVRILHVVCDLQHSLILLPPSSSLSAQTGLWFSAIYFRITEECVPRVSFWTHLYLHHVVVMKVLWARTIQSNLFLKCQAHIQDAIYWLIIKACTGTDQGLSMTAVIKQPTHIQLACSEMYYFQAILDLFSNLLFRFLCNHHNFSNFLLLSIFVCLFVIDR